VKNQIDAIQYLRFFVKFYKFLTKNLYTGTNGIMPWIFISNTSTNQVSKALYLLILTKSDLVLVTIVYIFIARFI